jgi:tetratricopeptide (TPR) repeat protein
MKKLVCVLVISAQTIYGITQEPVEVKQASEKLAQSIAEPNENAASNLHSYFLANYDQFGGKYQTAVERYRDVLDSGAPLYAYKGYVHLLFDTGNYKQILSSIPQLDSLFSKDAEIELIFAQVMERTGKTTEADIRFIKLNDQFKSNQEIAFSAANSYLRRKEPENAIKVINNLLNSSPRKPNNFIFYFMLAQIHLQLDDKTKALENIQKCLDLHPRFDKGWLLYALLNEQVGQLKDAIKGYTSFLEVTAGSNREVENHLLQLIFKQKMIEKNQGSMMVMNRACFDQALLFFEKKQYDQALQQIEQCMKERPSDDQAKLLKIQILSSMQKPQKAADALKTWIVQNPSKEMWYRTLHLLTATNLDSAYAIKILKEIQKQFPQELMPALYLSDLLTRNKMTEQSIEFLNKALALSKESKLKERILYQLARTHYQAKNFTELKKVMSQAEKMKSNFPPLLNLIAYYLTEHENNYSKAQELMTIVLKADRNNPHFLDTQAFIHLNQKDFDKAIPLLEKIAQKVPSDYTVLMHLAQARFGKGDKQKALITIGQAKKHAASACDKKDCEMLIDKWQQTKKA